MRLEPPHGDVDEARGTRAGAGCLSSVLRVPSPALRRPLVSAGVLTAAALSLAPPPARADRLSGTRSPAVVERDHEILVRIDRGVATLRARRTLYNGGARHDQAELSIDLPEAAVATGLRTRGTLRGKPTWFSGQLMEAELAAARYEELTGIGGYTPKDPALLSWREPDLLMLQVFPIAPRKHKQVEYTLSAPVDYVEGRYRLTLPRLGTDDRAATYTVEPARARDRLYLDGAPIRPGTRVTVTGDPRTLELAPRGPAWLTGRLAAVPTAAGRVLTHFDLETAPRMTRVPDDARVVVLVDASRSRDEGDVTASLVATDAYLAHFEAPDVHGARVALLSFDRRVRGHTAGFETVARARRKARELSLPRGNGSALDEALAQAERLLRTQPRPRPSRARPGDAPSSASARGSLRVIVFSDLNLRTELTRARLTALAQRTGAIVHLVDIGDGDVYTDSDQASNFAPVARATGGLVWDATARVDRRRADAEHRSAYEALARPSAIENIQFDAPSVEHRAFETMPEGAREGWFKLVDGPTPYVRVSGELWSEPFSEVFLPSEEEGARWSALVFGSSLLDELRPHEHMGLAVHGGAVSPVTSYLAIEPGVRPSTEGLEWNDGAIGIGSLGLIGKGAGGGRGSRRPDNNFLGFFQRALASTWRACGGRGAGPTIVIETTRREVADIPELRASAPLTPTARQCLVEAAWALDLPREFRRVYSRRWSVSL